MVANRNETLRGELDRTYAGDEFVGIFEGEAPPYAHYVLDVTELSTVAHDAFYQPVILEIMERCLGPDYWITSPGPRGAGAIQQKRHTLNNGPVESAQHARSAATLWQS